ncbi:MAG: hypothetical protein QNK03_07645, partial [Myxococcota bacterium]|nr:hypothetical protein [Myxococcota bacterium]
MSSEPRAPFPPHRESPATEAVHEATADLDRWDIQEVVAAVHAEDRRAWEAVEKELPQIVRAARVLLTVLRSGGRWFNVGAGTSGRMGCLDAAEIPPTFGLAPERVVGLIAGGPAALLRAVEGAEDDRAAGGAGGAGRRPAPPPPPPTHHT